MYKLNNPPQPPPKDNNDNSMSSASAPPLPSEADPKAAKQRATEQKYQLFSTWQAIQQGKMPHNAQLDEMLEKLIQNKVISSREHLISEDGKKLLNDLRNLLQTVRKTLSVKNKDELFQSLVYHLHCMDTPISTGKYYKKKKYSIKLNCIT